MDLSFNQLKKRDVVNVVDGKNYGGLTDLLLSFPIGKLAGIYVKNGNSKGIFRIFDRSRLFIPVSRIQKIGNDVILVNLNCGDTCEPNENLKPKKECSPCNPLCNLGNNQEELNNIQDYSDL